MISPEYCLRMAQYNQWMNEGLYTHCAGLPDETRRADQRAPFRSIYGTLNHLMVADSLWMGRFRKRPFSAQSLDQELYADFDAMRNARQVLDAQILAWVQTVDEALLASEFTFTTIVSPETVVVPYWFVLTHFFNHQTHHRGQLTTLLWQAGVDFGVTDLLRMPESPMRLMPG